MSEEIRCAKCQKRIDNPDKPDEYYSYAVIPGIEGKLCIRDYAKVWFEEVVEKPLRKAQRESEFTKDKE